MRDLGLDRLADKVANGFLLLNPRKSAMDSRPGHDFLHRSVEIGTGDTGRFPPKSIIP